MRYLSYWRKGIRIFPVLLTVTGIPGISLSQPDDLGLDKQDAVSEVELSQYSGGTEINIGDIGVNLASNSSSLNGNSVDGNVVTGGIGNNDLNDVSGINSLMFNTGNNVNFQSNMQINIFLK